MTTNPLRAKALSYLRSGRVLIGSATGATVDLFPARVDARVLGADGETFGSVVADVHGEGGTWRCSQHLDSDACAHRLAVQLVTGWGHLEGGSHA